MSSLKSTFALLCFFFHCIFVQSTVVPTPPSNEWVHLGRANPTQEHTVVFAVVFKEGAVERGRQILLQNTSNPNSPEYAKHLTLKQVEELFINFESLEKVKMYFSDQKFQFRVKGDFVWVTSTASRLETLLQTEFHRFAHQRTSTQVLRANTYVVPSEIKEDIELVFQVKEFPPVHKPLSFVHVDSPLASPLTPSVVQQLYNYPGEVTNSATTQGVLANWGAFSNNDVYGFWSQYGVPGASNIILVGPFNDSYCANHDCGEPTLDVEWQYSMAAGATTQFFYNSDADAFVDYANWISTDDSPAYVNSISLGAGQPVDYIQRLCNQVMIGGLRGVTTLAAAGDGGSFDSNCQAYNDVFPSACEYVTAVGGTQGPESGQPEQAWGGSGGGFTDSYTTPDWQAAALSNYLNNAPNLPPSSSFNGGGRAWPDISGVASYLVLIVNGNVVTAAGTSFAAPIVAGCLSQVNNARLNQGKAPIGFINQVIYSNNGQGFNDITSGSNPQCSSNYGFTAIQGWDAVTGWGTPNTQELISVFTALP